MLIQVITNLDNGAGLERDYDLLRHILIESGHTVRGVHIHRYHETAGRADLNIFLEVLVPELTSYAPKNWIVPNSEWWGGHWNVHLPRIDRVLCKNADCLRIWERKTPGKCTLVGWAASDLYNPLIKKEPKFLHTAGKSLTKNTAAVMEAWKRYKLPYKLTVSAFKPEIASLCQNVPNVRLVSRFTDGELLKELNSSRFFLMPSKYEGYGHAIHEALGCKAAVLTTDAEPMRSFSGVHPELLIRPTDVRMMAEATAAIASPRDIALIVTKAASMSEPFLDGLGDCARMGFHKDNDFFHAAIREVIRGL